MVQPLVTDRYFTKHLFRSGLVCPTKLFYKANNYPERLEVLPFIEHIYYNKTRLKTLVRCFFPEGKMVDSPSPEQGFSQTVSYLGNENVVLFNTVFIWQQMMVKFPIVEKKGREIDVFQFQTKAFNPDKHKLLSYRGEILSKWQDYLLDYSFQVYVIRQLYPDWSIHPYMILPNKDARSKVDRLHEILRAIEQKEIMPEATLINCEDLFVKLDVGELLQRIRKGDLIKKVWDSGLLLDDRIVQLKEFFFSNQKQPVCLGAKCKNCEFRIEKNRISDGKQSGFYECWLEKAHNFSVDTSDLVFDLIGPGTNKWIEKGIYFQQEIPLQDIPSAQKIEETDRRITERERQALQILKAHNQEIPVEIIKPQLFEELKSWEYPIHFLDFEAGNYTIPIRKNRKPYHLVVFQFSCHSLLQDGSWKHYEWIHNGKAGYPNYECIRQLRNISDIRQGTIVQYSDFERHSLKTIRKELILERDSISDAKEMVSWIENIIHRHDSNNRRGPYLADLSRIVKHYYYNNRMGDSLSIKDVLQTVMTVSPELQQRYSQAYSSSNFESIIWWQEDPAADLVKSPYSIILEQQGSGVRRGTEAMVVYGKLLFEEIDEVCRKEYLQSLLKYCELDTLAMLMIFQHWHSLQVNGSQQSLS